MAVLDDDEYWNQSTVAKSFNFDDGDGLENGEDVLRLFGLSASPSKQEHTKSLDELEVRSTHSDESKSAKSDSTTATQRKKSPAKRSFFARKNSLRSTQSSVTIQNALPIPAPNAVASSPSLSESSKVSLPKLHIPHPETYNRKLPEPESPSDSFVSEINYLRRQLEAARKDRWTKIPPKEMVWRIVRNQPYGLESYRGLEEKVALLDQALAIRDSDAVILTIFHMKSTLSPAFFFSELAKKPGAVDQYVTFLEADNRLQEAIDLLESLGRTEDAAIQRLKLVVKAERTEQRLRELDSCIKCHPPVVNPRISDLQHLRSYKSLLEVQRPIDDNDEKSARYSTNDLFTQFPRFPLLGTSPLRTLYYCCLYHFDAPETNLWSPAYIRRTFGISEKQFLWTAISALAKKQSWNDIQGLLTDRTGWFGVPKPKSAIGFDRVADILIRNSTPPDVLAYYLRLIEDPEIRLDLAIKSQCHTVSIDTLAALKEFDRLKDYVSKLPGDSRDLEYGHDILRRHKL